MRSVWDLAKLPIKKRQRIQDKKVRQMLIGAYAPCEAPIMEMISKFLEQEKKYPLRLVHRIMDRLASMSVSTTVMTYEEVVEFINEIPDDFKIARGPCACRIHTAEALGPDAKDFKAKKFDACCQTPLNVDIQIATCGEKFGVLEPYEYITKKELLRLEKECHNMGLVANVYMMMGGEAGICHCASETCVPFIANQAIKGKTSVIKKGKLLATTDMELCDGTGNCAKVCHFNARSIIMENGKPALRVDLSQCFGCGLCVDACPQEAIIMTPRKSHKKI